MGVTRTLQVTYAGLTIGGTSGRHIDRYTINDDSYERGSFECVFVTKECITSAAFSAECIAIETALRTPRGTLAVTDNALPLVSLSHSGNTGLDGIATCTKLGEEGDTGLSRRYRFRYECGRPADNTSTGGRRTGTIDVQYSPARRRRVTVSGVYTALGGSASRAQYLSQIDSYGASVVASLGITSYQIGEEPVTNCNDTDKVINFTRVYDELIFTPGVFADTSVIRAELDLSKERVGPGDTPTADRLAVVSARFRCWVNKDVTTDLVSKYSSVRSTVLNQIRGALSLGQICLISDKPAYNWTDNIITADITVYGVWKGGLLEHRETNEYSQELNPLLMPVWNGDPLAYYVVPGPQRLIRTETIVKRTAGASSGGGFSGSSAGGGSSQNLVVGIGANGGGFFGFNMAEANTGSSWSASAYARGASADGAGGTPGSADGGGAGNANQGQQDDGGGNGQLGEGTYIQLSATETITPLVLGVSDEQQISVQDTVTVKRYQLIHEVKSSGGGGRTNVFTPPSGPVLYPG
jgi:hypothetical protein